MKIRNGFVSNSSSSSFIIDHYDLYDYERGTEWTKESIKEEVKNIYKKWLKNRKKNVRRDSQNYINSWKKYDIPTINLKDLIQDKLTEYSKINIDRDFDNCIYVGTQKEINPLVKKYGATSLEYWYAGKDLYKDNLIIFDPNNYLPDAVNNLVAKRFKIEDDRRNHHMG